MNRLPSVRRAAAAAFVVATVAASIVVASAAPANASPLRVANTATEAYVRGAHFSPDTGAVDVYLSAFSGGTSTLWLSSVSYGDVSSYAPISAGVYAVAMRPHGAAASTPAVLTWTVNITAGSAYTAAAVGTNSQLRGIVLQDSTTPPAANTGLVRVIQASSQAGHLSVTAQNGPTLIGDIAYGAASDYVSVPAGTWTLAVKSATLPSLTTQSTITVKGGTLSSVVVLDVAGGGIVVHDTLDSSGASAVPGGSVSAGGGGTAPRTGSAMYPMLSAGAFGLAALVLLIGGLRRRNRREPIA